MIQFSIIVCVQKEWQSIDIAKSSLANAIPISSRTSINHKLQGKNLFTQWEIKRICELIEIPPTKVGRYFFEQNVQETCINVNRGNYGTNHINQKKS